jgi:hypothetical protein
MFPYSFNMVPITRSNSGALEHILSIICVNTPSTADSVTIPPHFHACLSKAGISNAYYFIYFEPNSYGYISFSITSFGDKDQQLNIIQRKKINSHFSWYYQVASPTVSRWFDIDNISFQAWCTCFQNLIWAHCCYHLLSHQAPPLPSVCFPRVSNVASLTTMSSRKIAPGTLGINTYLPLLGATMLITFSTSHAHLLLLMMRGASPRTETFCLQCPQTKGSYL